ncbi:hypothetical protein HMPREF9946_03434 [Acetobacteraceae bacterium AT-5844]|nr:hypothetical protein HMPREF9946_03434 [Acetobacteraceae bacterium AT-5844]
MLMGLGMIAVLWHGGPNSVAAWKAASGVPPSPALVCGLWPSRAPSSLRGSAAALRSLF